MTNRDKQVKFWATIYNDTFVNESKQINEIMTPAEIMKKCNAIKDARDKERCEIEAAKKAKVLIKSIWVKKINENSANDGKSTVTLEITYADGEVKEFELPFTMGQIHGHYDLQDQLAKEMIKQARQAGKVYIGSQAKASPRVQQAALEGNVVTDTDIKIAMLRVWYTDPNIQWMYGPRKLTDSDWAFADEAVMLANKAALKLHAPRQHKKWYEKPADRAVTYKHGNTTIYKTA